MQGVVPRGTRGWHALAGHGEAIMCHVDRTAPDCWRCWRWVAEPGRDATRVAPSIEDEHARVCRAAVADVSRAGEVRRRGVRCSGALRGAAVRVTASQGQTVTRRVGDEVMPLP